MIKICDICLVKASNYKCPKCYIPFCSVICGVTHKNSNCNALQKDERKQSNPLPAPEDSWTTDNTVSAEKLGCLRDDNRLRDILRNPALQDMLKCLDSSSTPEETLQESMKDPAFEEFVNVCLSVVDPEISDDR